MLASGRCNLKHIGMVLCDNNDKKFLKFFFEFRIIRFVNLAAKFIQRKFAKFCEFWEHLGQLVVAPTSRQGKFKGFLINFSRVFKGHSIPAGRTSVVGNGRIRLLNLRSVASRERNKWGVYICGVY